MTAPALAASCAPADRLPARRVLGALGMLGSPAFLVLWASEPAPTPSTPPDARAHLLMFAYVVAWACSAAGLRGLRATGHGRGARTLHAVQALGLALAAAQSVQELTGRRPFGPTFYAATDLAWPIGHLLMLLVFAAVWRAKTWTGWRRWTSLACGLALPAAGVAGAVGGRAAASAAFAATTAAAFAALGLAVATAPAQTPAR